MTFTDVVKSFSGLVGYWPLNSDWQAHAAVGGIDGTAGAAVTFSSTAATFDGTTNSYITIPDNDKWSIATTGDITVIAFMAVTQWSQGSRALSGTNPFCHWLGKVTTGSPYEWVFRHYFNPIPSGDNRPTWLSAYTFNSTGGTGAGARFYDPPPASPNPTTAERFFAATYDNHSTSGALSGNIDPNNPGLVQAFMGTSGTTITLNDSDGMLGYPVNFANTNSPLNIGGRAGAGQHFIGTIRRVAIYNRTLSKTDLETIFNARTQADDAYTGSPPATGTPKLENLTEKFTSADTITVSGGEWLTGSATSGLSVVNGVLRILPDSASGGIGLRSPRTWSLLGSSVFAEMTPPALTSSTSQSTVWSRMLVQAPTSFTSPTDIHIRVTPFGTPTIFFWKRSGSFSNDTTGDVAGGSASLPYNATNHRWVRIRTDATNLYFETSANGTTWAAPHRTTSIPAWVTAGADLRVVFDTQKDGVITSSDYATLDNINHAASVVAHPTDDFDTKDLTKWSWKGAGSAVSGGDLILPPNTQVDAFGNGIVSNSAINLVNGPVYIRVNGYPTVAGPTPTLIFALSTTNVAGTTADNRIYFAIPMTSQSVTSYGTRYTVGGIPSDTQINVTGPDPLPVWFRFSKSGGQVLWETSINGAVWVTRRSVPITALPLTTALYINISAIGPSSATGSFNVASINVAPVSPNPVAPSAPQTFTVTAGEEELDLAWTAPASDGGSAIKSYVLRGTSLPTNPLILTASTLSYTNTGLTPGTTYTYDLTARNDYGESVKVSGSGIPDAPPSVLVPSQPLNVVATAGNASALIDWDAPTTPNGTIDWYKVISYPSGAPLGRVRGTSTSTTITNLLNGTAYVVQVVAENADGDSAPSLPSNPFVPVASGSSETPLSTRACFGAAPGIATYSTIESAIGRVLQPVARDYRLGDPFPSAEISTLAGRDRSMMLMLDTSGMSAISFLSGSMDTVVAALGASIDATNRYVYVCPFHACNDWVQPWSPYYSTSSPGYDSTKSMGMLSVDYQTEIFRSIARILREATPYVRMVWSVNVETQPQPVADAWANFYPGPAADIAMLVGRNYGVGPLQGRAGQTSWQEANEIFNHPYSVIAAAIQPSTPLWLWTACHDPSTSFTPSAPGYAPGASIPVDSTESKAAWVTTLFELQTMARVQAVVWEDRASTRNWPIGSSSTSSTAFNTVFADPDDWNRTQIDQDQLGDHMHNLISGMARWARSGPYPATRFNEYVRPDTRTGVRVSLTHSTPYSSGTKTSTTVSRTDMEKWNRIHGLILREIARRGIQGWAHASGTLPKNHPSLLHTGVSDANGVRLTTEFDALPGPIMQSEGGMKLADGGTDAPQQVGPPTIVSTTPSIDSISMAWDPPGGSFTITGYTFTVQETGYSQFFASPPDPFVFTGLLANTTYTIGIKARTALGDGPPATAIVKTTVPTIVTPATGLPAKPCGLVITNYTTSMPAITTYDQKYTVLLYWNLVEDPAGPAGSVKLVYPADGSGTNTGYTNAEFIADVQTVRAAPRNQKFVLILGSPGAQIVLDTDAKVDACYNSLKAIAQTLGGFDGLFFNNFDNTTDATPSPKTTSREVALLAKKLKSDTTNFGGANFIIGGMPGAWDTTGGFEPRLFYQRRAFALLHAEKINPSVANSPSLLDWICPRLYGGSGLALYAQLDEAIQYYIVPTDAVGLDGVTKTGIVIPRTKIGIGFGIDDPLLSGADSYWTSAGAAAAFEAQEAAYLSTNPRGAFNWSSGNPTGVTSFITDVEPVIVD